MTLILALIFALIVAVFAIQNASEVMIHFFFWTFKTNLVLVILGALAIGAMILFLIGVYKNFIVRREKNQAILEKDNLILEKEKLLGELENLKNDLIRANEALDQLSSAPNPPATEQAAEETGESEKEEGIDQ